MNTAYVSKQDVLDVIDRCSDRLIKIGDEATASIIESLNNQVNGLPSYTIGDFMPVG
ncbi:MAG: hypothetical protein IJ392_04965 [Clostridia bacterium]|nr:hypothetical protein [Clostridia bacterium]